jgi:hypothetical protein
MPAERFLHKWLSENIKPVHYNSIDEVSKASEELCIAEAAGQDITRRELQNAAAGNLRKCIKNALEDARDAEVKKNAPPSGTRSN